MINYRRLFLASLTLVFGAFNVALALMRVDRYVDSWETILVGVTYFVSLALCTVGFRQFKLPVWVAWLAAMVSLAMPIVSQLSLLKDVNNAHDTWYVTAIALLLSAIAVRGRTYFAIVVGPLVFAEVIWFDGWERLPQTGVTGAALLIAACISISAGLDRANREIETARNKIFDEASRSEFQRLVTEEHKKSINQIREAVLPTLEEIADGGKFTRAQRDRYTLMEEGLRDDIAGGRLATRKLKKAMAAARERGVDVALLDEGGLELVARFELEQLIDLVIAALSGVATGRVTVRTQPDEPWLIRVTASRPRVVAPDLDLKLGER